MKSFRNSKNHYVTNNCGDNFSALKEYKCFEVEKVKTQS